MKYLIVILLFAFSYGEVDAQQITKKVTEHFSDNIIRRVYDLTVQLGLSEERQIVFGSLFEKQDSLIAAAIRQHRSPQEIESIIISANKAFDAALSTKEYDQYHLKHEVVFVDSVLKVLDNLKPVSEAEQQHIADSFLRKRRQSAAGSLSYDFLQVIRSVLDDTTYYAHLYKDEIEYMAEEFVLNYPKRRNYPEEYAEEIMQEIRTSLKSRQRGLRVIDYVLPNPSKEKDDFRNAVMKKYSYNIRKSEISHGVHPPKTLFVTAYLNRRKLHLYNHQADSLLEYAIRTEFELLPLLYKNSPELGTFRQFEKQTIIRFAGTQKYAAVLAAEYASKADKWANDQWREMEKYKLTDNLQKNKEIKSLARFQLRKMVAKEMFAQEPEKLEADIRIINKQKPLSLNALEYAKKSPAGKEALQKGFNW